jgi:enamine deaminase RidA (YjgF/YER057c/UK114 family)
MANHEFICNGKCNRCNQTAEDAEPNGCPKFCGECGIKLYGYLHCFCGISGEEWNGRQRAIQVQLQMSLERITSLIEALNASTAELIKAQAVVEKAEKYIDDLKETNKAWREKYQEAIGKQEQVIGEAAAKCYEAAKDVAAPWRST